MKTLLTILLLASLATNVVLLVGCTTLNTQRFTPPKPLSDADLEEIVKGVPDEQRTSLQGINHWLENLQGKSIVVLPSTEEFRNARRIVITFDE